VQPSSGAAIEVTLSVHEDMCDARCSDARRLGLARNHGPHYVTIARMQPCVVFIFRSRA
jgi:hypothetical protein